MSNDLRKVLTLLAAAAVMALPLLLVELPPLVDYPQHLARAHLLVHLPNSAELARYYQVQDGLVPYFAWDALAVPLTHWLGTYRAGQVGLMVVFLMLTAATLTLQRVVQGSVRWEAAAILPCLYSTQLAWGNVTFLPGVALAVFALAGWIASAGWPPLRRVAVFTVVSMGLFLGHIIALGIFALLAMSFELGRLWRGGPRLLAKGLAVGALQFLAPAALWPLVGAARETHPSAFLDFSQHLWALATPLAFDLALSHDLTPGSVVDGATIVAAGVSLYAGLRSRRLRLAPALRWPLAVGGMVALAMPVILFGVWGMHLRLPIALAGVLAAGIAVDWPSSRHARLAVLGLGLLLAARLVVVTGQMAGCAGVVAELRAAIADMPVGARVLTVMEDRGVAAGLCRADRGFTHAAMIAVIDRAAWASTLFDDTSIIAVRPPYTLTEDAGPLWPDELRQGAAAPPIPRPSGPAEVAQGWPKVYTHVLWLHFGQPVEPVPVELRAMRRSALFDLYAVVP